MSVWRRIGLGLLLLSAASCSSSDQSFTLAFSTEEPADSISQSIQGKLGDAGILIEFVERSDPTDIYESVQNGSVDLGVLEEPNHPIPGIVTIAPLYPSVLHVLHNLEGEPANLISLMRDSKIYAGPLGGAAHRLIIQLAIDFGIAADEFQILDNPWIVKPDVYFIIGGLLPQDSIEQLEQDGYRLFSFASADDISGGSVADAIALRHHHLKTFLLPKGIYYSLSDKPITTLSIRTVMIANEQFPTDIARRIATNLFNNAQEYSMNYPLVIRELNSRFNPVDLIFPLHSGSRQFLNRDEPGFIEKNVDLIALILTIILAIGSGLFTLYRRHLQIKKDRVDRYYSKLLVVRRNAESSTDRDTLKSQRVQAIAVQQEVLQLLIDERVSADASLVAFLSLSNQIINELSNRIGYSGR